MLHSAKVVTGAVINVAIIKTLRSIFIIPSFIGFKMESIRLDVFCETISDHQQSCEYEDGPWKGPRPPLLVAADF
jgi:hypothetical protein